VAASGSVALSSSLHLSSLVSGRDNCCTTDTKSGRLEESGFLWCTEPLKITRLMDRLTLPAVYHEFVNFSWAPRRWSKTYSFLNELYILQISATFKRFVSETPYLIHDTTKAPHITGSGVLLVVEGL
jgi:hypothetical protein